MMAASSLIGELRTSLSEEMARIRQSFEANGDGRTAVSRRTRLIEEILHKLWSELISPIGSSQGSRANFALVATGGFGRGWGCRRFWLWGSFASG